VEAVRRLWDSWEDDAEIRDAATGRFIDRDKLHYIDIPFPAPAQARSHTWTPEEWALVADRVDTQFVGSPRQVADRLERLRDATGADELIITTITHEHANRVRSYELLAEEWNRRDCRGRGR
jgi:alkanesulfonate monooxygenase SsuD/methylene tetrahydromethanopterin reductase-like flavin-dependent oxidoreductase (luciferase family)